MSKLELNYDEIRLIEAGLNMRDIHNQRIINRGINVHIRPIDNAYEEHQKIYNIKDKLAKYLAEATEEQEQEEQPSKTYILQAKQTLHKNHIDNAERELCKKLKANVVIIPAQYNYLGIDYGNQQDDTAACNIVLDGVAISKALVDKVQLYNVSDWEGFIKGK